MRSQLLGIPTPFYALLAVAALAMIVIRRTVYGRTLLAVGQSGRAAHLAGIDVDRTVLVVFMISGGLAGLTGPLLAASVGSADLELGNRYLLASVGAVVLGGNQIAGGTATVVGTIFGAILLTLLVAAVTMAGLPIEFQNIARGAVITLVLVVVNAPETWAVAMRRMRAAPGLSDLSGIRGPHRLPRQTQQPHRGRRMTASISDYGLDRDWTADVVGYPDPAIEVCDPRFERYRVLPASIERLWTGGRWTEGPAWFGDARCLLFSDIPNERILSWSEVTGAVTVCARPRASPTATPATGRGGSSPASMAADA